MADSDVLAIEVVVAGDSDVGDRKLSDFALCKLCSIGFAPNQAVLRIQHHSSISEWGVHRACLERLLYNAPLDGSLQTEEQMAHEFEAYRESLVDAGHTELPEASVA